jgi:hypothetical protein
MQRISRFSMQNCPNLDGGGWNVQRSALCVQERPERNRFEDFGHSCTLKRNTPARERA